LAIQADVHQKDDPICSSAGCTQYLHPKEKSYPIDYPVADFGKDHDIKATESHTKQVEAALGHTWNPDKDDDGEWIDMPTETAEFKLTGTKQDVHMESDPAFNSHEGYETRHSNPYDKEKKEVLYSPLDLPYDHDIQSSLTNLDQSEKVLGKKMDLEAVQLSSQVETKSAVKSKGKTQHKAVAKAQTSEFSQLREKMMNNWGLKN